MDQFVLKQQEYEQKKQEKIRQRQYEKLDSERREFEKNATFQPNLVTNKRSTSPQSGSN